MLSILYRHSSLIMESIEKRSRKFSNLEINANLRSDVPGLCPSRKAINLKTGRIFRWRQISSDLHQLSRCPNSSTQTQQSSPPPPFRLETENPLQTPFKTFSRPILALLTGIPPRPMTMTRPSVSILKKSTVCTHPRSFTDGRFTE